MNILSKSLAFCTALTLCGTSLFAAPKATPVPKPPLEYPPILPDGKTIDTETSPDFLKPLGELLPGVEIAKTAPTVEFQFIPGQTYAGNPWSNWGDSLCANGKYYLSAGDHLAPQGNAYVYEYDPETKAIRQISDIRKTLNLPEGHYTPGKIHSRLDMGSDGWIYYSTHRGSTKVTTDQYHYLGDWIMRCDPTTAKTEVVAQGPVPKHCIPCSVVDPKRMIFYGGTAPGSGGDEEGVQFFAYDLNARKVLYSGPNGPARATMLAKSTGRLYFNPSTQKGGALVRYDPAKPTNAPVPIDALVACRAATEETADGFIYAVSTQQEGESIITRFNTKTETAETLGNACVGSQTYITSIDVDATGRYLYYVPGAHGGASRDGSAVVQFDTKTGKRKVLAFLSEHYKTKFGDELKGTYSSAIDRAGDKLYITWNNSRSSKAWDSCVLTVINIPASERGGE